MSHSLDFMHFGLEELHIFLDHLRLGADHLKKQLNEQQWKELLELAPLNSKVEKQLAIDHTEKVSQIVMMANSMVTGVFGVWMGLSTFFNLEMRSTRLIGISSLAFILGASMSFLNLMKKKQEAEQAIVQQRLKKIELRLIQTINQKLKGGIQELATLLHSFQSARGIKQEDGFEKEESFQAWFKALKKNLTDQLKAIPQEPIYEKYRTEILCLLAQVKEVCLSQGVISGSLADSLKKKRAEDESSKENFHVLKVLTDPKLACPKMTIAPKHFRYAERGRLIFGLIPTVLGSLGSILMWYNTIPSLAKNLEMQNVQVLFHHSYTYYVEVALAFVFTLQFAFFYIYSVAKSKTRQKDNEWLQKEVNNQEVEMLAMAKRCEVLNLMQGKVNEIHKVLTFIDELKRIN